MPDRALFVSPHLDDAVLSCAGRILDERARGADVLVATLFSAGGDGDDGASYAARRAEDRAALDALGVRGVHLGLRDAPARRGHAPSFRALIFDELPRDAADGREAAAQLAELAAGATRRYFPLGVGGHVDHRLAFDVSFSVAGEVRFYEDRPYARVPGAVGARLRELGAGDAPDGCDAAAYRAGLERAPFMRAWLPDGAERAACLDELTARFTRPPAPTRLVLAAETRTFDDATVARARAAIGAYRSQLADLFGGEPLLDGKTYFERFWIRR